MPVDLLMGLLKTKDRVDIECNAIFGSYQKLQHAATGNSVQDLLIENGLKAGRGAYVTVNRV